MSLTLFPSGFSCYGDMGGGRGVEKWGVAEKYCTGSSLRPLVNMLCQSEHKKLDISFCFVLWFWHILWLGHINSLVEQVVCLDAKDLIACDTICHLKNSGLAVPTNSTHNSHLACLVKYTASLVTHYL